ncbi:MAG: hypothetical protein JWQ38_1079 [Flavipsychrobacter sp.]|nr:hypothetical protein [Flavipsychrobacter sp.]
MILFRYNIADMVDVTSYYQQKIYANANCFTNKYVYISTKTFYHETNLSITMAHCVCRKQ